MKGPPPKSSDIRQRQNRSATRSTLPSEEESAGRKVPVLPKREKATEVWHPNVLAWWSSVWKSPMAQEYVAPDILGGLHLLAELYQCRWSDPDASGLVKLASEIRQQEIRFGLSPIDRRRLEWEIEKGDQAAARTDNRRKVRQLVETSKKDPREVLKVV